MIMEGRAMGRERQPDELSSPNGRGRCGRCGRFRPATISHRDADDSVPRSTLAIPELDLDANLAQKHLGSRPSTLRLSQTSLRWLLRLRKLRARSRLLWDPRRDRRDLKSRTPLNSGKWDISHTARRLCHDKVGSSGNGEGAYARNAGEADMTHSDRIRAEVQGADMRTSSFCRRRAAASPTTNRLTRLGSHQESSAED